LGERFDDVKYARSSQAFDLSRRRAARKILMDQSETLT